MIVVYKHLQGQHAQDSHAGGGGKAFKNLKAHGKDYNAINSNFTDDDEFMCYQYNDVAGTAMNMFLRGTLNGAPSYVRSQVDNWSKNTMPVELDKIMSRNGAKTDFAVNRGVRGEFGNMIKKNCTEGNEGWSFMDKAFVSTSASEDVMDRFKYGGDHDAGVRMKINVKAGSPCVSWRKDMDEYGDLAEVLLARNSTFVFSGIQKDSSGNKTYVFDYIPGEISQSSLDAPSWRN